MQICIIWQFRLAIDCYNDSVLCYKTDYSTHIIMSVTVVLMSCPAFDEVK